MSATLEQRRTNLDRANEVRIAGAQIKRELRAGRLALDVALASPAIANKTVWDVLNWIPYVGPRRAMRILNRVQISPLRRAGMITERQRRLLAQALA